MKGPLLVGFLLIVPTAALAATAGDFETAYMGATKTAEQALAKKSAWTTTETKLEDAKKAADAGKYDEAVALAKEAEVLAKLSLEQAAQQERVWRETVVK